MLEGTMSVAAETAGVAEGGSRTLRRPDSGSRRRDLLARLAAMSLVDLDPARGSHPAAETEATVVARAWLDLIHSGRSASSWAVAAPVLRETIEPEEWRTALGSVRAALGRCHSRRLRSQTALEAFPGVPRGPYTVTRFESGFETRPKVTETVTTCLGDDGCWRVAAYFIR
ncbi:MAG: DUF4019 domain-containing protein [Acidobacteriota bacterium]